MIPPNTKPKVAHAIAISVAAGRLNSLMNVSAQAAPVPWPPVNVTEPANKPYAGSIPKSSEPAIPITF